MKGESMDALKLARLICDKADAVYDDMESGTVTLGTIKTAKSMREEAIVLVDKLLERKRK